VLSGGRPLRNDLRAPHRPNPREVSRGTTLRVPPQGSLQGRTDREGSVTRKRKYGGRPAGRSHRCAPFQRGAVWKDVPRVVGACGTARAASSPAPVCKGDHAAVWERDRAAAAGVLGLGAPTQRILPRVSHLRGSSSFSQESLTCSAFHTGYGQACSRAMVAKRKNIARCSLMHCHTPAAAHTAPVRLHPAAQRSRAAASTPKALGCSCRRACAPLPFKRGVRCSRAECCAFSVVHLPNLLAQALARVQLNPASTWTL